MILFAPAKAVGNCVVVVAGARIGLWEARMRETLLVAVVLAL